MTWDPEFDIIARKRQLPVLPSRTHDNTMLTTYERCPRLYYLQYVRNLVPRGRTPALDFGSLVHLGLSIWYASFNVPGMTHQSALEHALDAMLKADYADVHEDHRTRERALLTMAEYAEYYGWMERTQGWNLKVILSETAFDTIDENGLPWGGKIDLVVEWRNGLWILDHKTTSRFGEDSFYDQFVPDTQTCGYAKYAGVLAGKPVAGVIMNAIVIHKVKKPKDQQFKRRAFEYPDFYYREWTEQVVDALRQIRESEDRNMWRPRWRSCVEKYGKCPAYYVCRSRPENREAKLAAEWEERTWNWRDVEGAEKQRQEGLI